MNFEISSKDFNIPMETNLPLSKGRISPVAQMLLNPNFFEFFGERCSFLDLFLFGKSLMQDYPILASSFLRRLNFRTLVDKRLQELGIETEAFWKAMKESGAVLHGSFLLSCLLDPISGKRNKIFEEKSDIDILEPSGMKKLEFCPSCLRRLDEKRFPKEIKRSQKKIAYRLFGTKSSTHDQLSRSLFKHKIAMPDYSPGFYPHLFGRNHKFINSLDKFFCHSYRLQKCSTLNYSEMFDSHLVWGNGKIAVDQCTISVQNKSQLLAWVKKNVDFAFGKIVYDGEKLTIFDLNSLLSKTSEFPDIEAVDPQEIRKYKYSSAALSGTKKKRILQLWERTQRYQRKGFNIIVSPKQMELINLALEEDKRHKKIVRP
jgi:hypothetical protein